MLRRLRRNFVAVAMSIAGAVLLASLGSSFFSSYTTQQALTEDLLSRALSAESWAAATIGEGGGQGADVMLAVSVDVGFDGTVSLSSATPLTISDPALNELLSEALSSESASGRNPSYHVAWKRAATRSGWRVAFADTYSRDAALRAQATMDLAIFLVAMAVLLVIVTRLARWILRPVEEAWDQQRRFVSDASHELKTPLAVILANAQILETVEGVPEEARRWARSTAEEATHMKGLVEDMLTLARADEQRACGEGAGTGRVELSTLVDGCALEFDAVAFERGCSIESRLEPGLAVTGDASQLGRLVRTLLDNATKYAAAGSAVRVSLAREGRAARLAVTNLGDPIAPEDLEHLFDRFYRTDRARGRQPQGGFGLGLAIARSIAEAHGGTISATSSAEAGTTFTVVLPLA